MRTVIRKSTVSFWAGALMLLTLLGCGAPPTPTPPGPTKALWTEQFGSNASDEARTIASDSEGNVIVAGTTWGDLEGTSEGDADVFVLALGPDGTLAWTRQFGTAEEDFGYNVATDPEGNIFVAGYTFGDLVGVSEGASDVFVRKYSKAGVALWTRQFGTSGWEDLRGLATDAEGSVFLAGSTTGVLAGVSEGGYDVFVRKYDASGTVGWTHQFGTIEDDGARALTTDSAGNVIVAGYTKGSLDGDGAGESDVFVRKLTPEGVPLWTHQLGTSVTDSARGVATDAAGNIVVVGRTKGALQGASAGDTDVFVRRLDPDGVHLWTLQFGTSGNDRPGGVAIDSQGEIVVAGYTNGDLHRGSAGGYDVFVHRLNPDGELLWADQFGTSAEDRARAVAADPERNVIIAGNTSGVLAGGGYGDQDVFVRTYEP